MTIGQALIVGLQLQHISEAVGERTKKKLEPFLKRIEETVMEDAEYKSLLAEREKEILSQKRQPESH